MPTIKLQWDYYIKIMRLTPTRHPVYAAGMSSEHALFLSSSAENHWAESAPRCAELSLKRAMSDNSNSTGSSASSTNSWTLLSPEVRLRNQLRKTLPRDSLRLDTICSMGTILPHVKCDMSAQAAAEPAVMVTVKFWPISHILPSLHM